MGGISGIDRLFIFTSSWKNSTRQKFKKKNGELTWDPKAGSDVVIHYYTHDLTERPWKQSSFWDENRTQVRREKEIVRVLRCM